MTCELYFSETVIKKKSHGPKYYARHFDKFRSLEGFFFFWLNFWVQQICQLIDVAA